MNVFITGSTGFLGGEILMLLSKHEAVRKIYCLLRAQDEEDALKRLQKVFDLHGDYFDESKVIPVIGNLAAEGLLSELTLNERIKDVDVIIHSAANTSFSKIYNTQVEQVNILGFKQILAWSKTLQHLQTFVYVGTATIIGKGVTDRLIYETESPDLEAKHIVKYTYTKMMGEILLRESLEEDKILIVRPSIIMGDSRDRTPRSNVILWTLAAVNTLRLIPVRSNPRLDIISVDFAAKAIVNLLFSKRNHSVYHVSAGLDSSTSNKKITDAISPFYENRPDFKFVDQLLLNQIKLWAKSKLPEQAELNGYQEYLEYWQEIFEDITDLRILFGGMDPYLQFIDLGQMFDNTRLLQDTGMDKPEPVDSYITRSIEYLSKIDILEGAIDP